MDDLLETTSAPGQGIRGQRRYHKQRMRHRAQQVYPDWPESYKAADHLQACSCPSCGNPRRHFGQLTRQEVRAMQAEEA